MKTKQYNRLPAKVANRFKSLPWSNFQEAEKNETFIVFYDDCNSLIGVTLIKFLGFEAEDRPGINIYIDKFEILASRRTEGWSKKILDWLVNSFNVRKISLKCVDPEYDLGSSYLFWTYMGFQEVEHYNFIKIW